MRYSRVKERKIEAFKTAPLPKKCQRDSRSKVKGREEKARIEDAYIRDLEEGGSQGLFSEYYSACRIEEHLQRGEKEETIETV